MNQSTTYRFNSTSISLPESNNKSKSHSSLLSRIFRKFRRYSKFYKTEYQAKYRHKSYLDANLLDQNAGPEISRTLR